MNTTNKKPKNSKFLVLLRLSEKNRISIDQAEKIAKNWLTKYSDKSWNDLFKLLEKHQVVYRQGILHDLSPFTREQIDLIIDQIKEINGIKIKDRWYHARLYRKCFIGCEAVKWLISNHNLSRKEALKLGQILIQEKIFHHVHDEHDFEDDYLFYRFYTDE